MDYLERLPRELSSDVADSATPTRCASFDTKDERDRRITADAPKITDHLCEACAEHFEAGACVSGRARRRATASTPALVRGLDYYTRTAWEFKWPQLGAQSTIGGGGRYDGLAEAIGGAPTPGVGFGAGLERLLLALGEAARRLPAAAPTSSSRSCTRRRARACSACSTRRAPRGLYGEADLAGRGAQGPVPAGRPPRRAPRRGRRDGGVGRGGHPVHDIGEQTRCRWTVWSTSARGKDGRGDATARQAAASCARSGVGDSLTLSGWVARRRDHGGLVFVDLRDRTGVVQVVIDPEDAPGGPRARARPAASRRRARATGERRGALAGDASTRASATGEVEVRVARARACSRPAEPLPFQLDDENVDETLRIRHRASTCAARA